MANTAIRAGDRQQWKRFLVQDEAGKLVGSLELIALNNIPTNQWPQHQVKDLLAFIQPIPESNCVDSKQSLLAVATQLEEQSAQTLAVTGDNGVLLGLLEKSAIIKKLQAQQQTENIQSA